MPKAMEQPQITSITREEAKAKLVTVVELEASPDIKIENLKVEALEGSRSSSSQRGSQIQAENSEDETSTGKFVLNPVVKAALGIDKTERREIERQVQMRLALIAEEGKKKGYEQGYVDGLEQGRKEAYEKFQIESQEVKLRLEDFLVSCNMAKWRIFEENERFLIELIFQISKKVLLVDLKQDSEFLLRLSKALIDKVGVKDHVMLRIHPLDAARIEYLNKELRDKIPDLKDLQVEISEKVAVGGCEVETQWSHISVHLEEQLEEIHKALTTGQSVG